MPYANNRGVHIHYEIEGQGPPLVVQYGQYWPLEIWHEMNYVSALKNDCQLILVDARGQGQSDKPDNPEAYRIELMVNDIVAVVDDLGFEKVHYMGYSSAGLVGFGLAKFTPERLSSLIIGGADPYEDRVDRLPWRNEQIQILEQQTAEDFVAGIEQFLPTANLPPLSPRLRTAMLMHDPRALIAWLQQSAEWPSFEDILGAISVPCLLYAGESSGEYSEVQKAAQEIQDATFVGIPDGGHLEGGTWVTVLRPYITQIVASAGAA